MAYRRQNKQSSIFALQHAARYYTFPPLLPKHPNTFESPCYCDPYKPENNRTCTAFGKMEYACKGPVVLLYPPNQMYATYLQSAPYFHRARKSKADNWKQTRCQHLSPSTLCGSSPALESEFARSFFRLSKTI